MGRFVTNKMMSILITIKKWSNMLSKMRVRMTLIIRINNLKSMMIIYRVLILLIKLRKREKRKKEIKVLNRNKEN